MYSSAKLYIDRSLGRMGRLEGGERRARRGKTWKSINVQFSETVHRWIFGKDGEAWKAEEGVRGSVKLGSRSMYTTSADKVFDKDILEYARSHTIHIC